jgi:hypothetical protein
MSERNRQLLRGDAVFLFVIELTSSTPSPKEMIRVRSRIIQYRPLPNARPKVIAIFEEILLHEEMDVVDLCALAGTHLSEIF